MGITLAKRESFNDYIDIDEEVKLKIDYPDRKQSVRLKELLLDAGTSDGEITFGKMYSYIREYIRYTVKGWKGVKNDKDEDVECVLVKGGKELDDDLLYQITENYTQAMMIYSKIENSLKFTSSDKKK